MRYRWSLATLALLAFAQAKITQLQRDCESAGALYGVGKCWVWQPGPNINWATAFSRGCNDLGRTGHLPYLASRTEREFYDIYVKNEPEKRKRTFINLRQNRTDPANLEEGWQWVLADGGLHDAVDIIWKWQQPADDPDPDEMYGFYSQGSVKTVSDWRNISNHYCVYDDLDRVQQYTLHLKDRLPHSISDEGQIDKVDCALACRKHELCASFSWKTTDGHCVLSPDDGNFTISTAVNASDYEWFVAVYNFS